MIGLLFASFGVTLLTVSMPMGAVSDRIGRKAPLVGGLIALAAATLLFAFADYAAVAVRRAAGAGRRRRRHLGRRLRADRRSATASTSAGASPASSCPAPASRSWSGRRIGGWLYELGGIRLPFLAVAALALLAAALFAWIDLPRARTEQEAVPLGVVLRVPAVAACAAGGRRRISATLSMLEPVLALHLGTLGIGPARIGILFGIAAVMNAMLHPLFGRFADRWGARRMMLLGLHARGIRPRGAAGGRGASARRSRSRCRWRRRWR